MLAAKPVHLFAAIAAAGFVLVLTTLVPASTLTWNAGNAQWNVTSTVWSGATVATPWDSTNGPTNVADFTTSGVTATVSGTDYSNGVIFDAPSFISGGTLNLSGGSPTITVNASSGTIGSTLAGAAGLSKNGGGTLTLNAPSSPLTGQVTVNSGTLLLKTGSVASSGTIINASGLVINGGTVNALNDNSIWNPFYRPGERSITINSGGLLTGGSGTSQGSTHLGPLTLSGGTLASNGYNSTWGGWYLDGDVTVTGGGTLTISAQKIYLNYIQPPKFIVTAGSVLNFVGNTESSANGNGSGPLHLTGGGLMILGGVNNYFGETIVSQGTLQVGVAGAIPNNPTIVFDSPANVAMLDVHGFNMTINALEQYSRSATNMIVNNSSGTCTLTLGTKTGQSVFSGVLANNSDGGSGVLAVTTTGDMILNGNNTYTGATTIAAGDLVLNGSNATSSISIAPSTELSGTGSAIYATTTLLPGAGIVGGNNGAGSLSLGGLTFLGRGGAYLTNAANYSSVPAMSVGALSTSPTAVTVYVLGALPLGSGTAHVIGYSGAIGGSGFNFTVGSPASGGRQKVALANDAGFVDFTYSVDNPYWTGSGNRLWTLTDQSPNYNWTLVLAGSGTNYITGDNVLFDNRATNTTVQIGDATVTPASVTVNNDGAHNYTFIGSGSIAGATGLTKSGSGSLTMNLTNSYSGTTTIQGGTVYIGADSALGTAPATATASDIVLSGGTLSANNTFSLNANRGIALGPVGGSGSGSIDVSSGTLSYGGVLANATGGTGVLSKTGSGTLVLSGTATFTGGTSVVAGNLVLTNYMAVVDGSNLTVGAFSSLAMAPAAAISLTPQATAETVPEPSTIFLLACAVMPFVLYAKRVRLLSTATEAWAVSGSLELHLAPCFRQPRTRNVL